MTSTPLLKRNLAALAVAATVIGGGAAAAVAAERPERPTLTAQTAQSETDETSGQQPQRPERAARPERGRPERGRPRRPLAHLARRAVHGDLVVRGQEGSFEEVTFDRGKLTSTSAGTLTLERPDGVSVTVTLTDATRYRGVESADDLHTGQPVVVVSKDGVASLVAQRGADRAPIVNGNE